MPLILIVLAALAGVFGWQQIELHEARSARDTAIHQRDDVTQKHAAAVASAAAAASAADTNYRALELKLATMTKEKDDALAQEKAVAARALAAVHVDDVRLRTALTADPAPAGATCEVAAAAERAAAADRGDVLATTVQQAEDDAGEAETLGADYRALFGWASGLSCGSP